MKPAQAHVGPEISATLLPETRAYLDRQGVQINLIVDAILASAKECHLHPQVTISACASALLTTLVNLDLEAGLSRDLAVSGIRGLAETLLAWCDAPDQAAGRVAVDACVQHKHAEHFEVLDNAVAAVVNPKA